MNMWKKDQDDPVILTLSSDEEEEEESSFTSHSFRSVNENSDSQNESSCLEPINPKEPIIKPNSYYENYKRHHNNLPDVSYEQQLMLQASNEFIITLPCRYLRIGSYKVAPINRIIISYNGIEVQVPPFAEGEKKPVGLIFKMKGILKVLAHLGHSLPVLFIYITDPMAADIRSQLKMTNKNGFYFDPCSHEESQKRVTVLLEKVKADMVNLIKNVLNIDICDIRNGERSNLFEELSQKDANEILVKSSPGEVDSIIQSSKSCTTYETKTLVVFPPPPNKGGISITMDDYLCLKEEQFLNDVLIDFYLKWLHMCHLTETDRERTHMFSTFFYKRLTAKPKTGRRSQCTEDLSELTPSQRRHSRVKSWTKHVDIFTKDFLLIPINEHAHWFLAVICFPNLSSPIRIRDEKPVAKCEAVLPTRSMDRQRKRIEIPVIDGDWSDRDEAEGDDNELSIDDDDDDDDLTADDYPPRKRLREQLEPIKQPCILIFDSLSGEPRSRIVATLRDYLAEEYLHRKGTKKVFFKDTMQGACPKVPQQMNFSDCGLFTLQFAQSFFERPLEDFKIPVQSLAEWFDQDVVGSKRAAIADLIQSLMDQHKPNHSIVLPPIQSGLQLDGVSSPADQKDPDYSPDEMFVNKSDATTRSKTEQLKSIHISPKECPDAPSDSSNATSVIQRTNNRESPESGDGDKAADVVGSVKCLRSERRIAVAASNSSRDSNGKSAETRLGSEAASSPKTRSFSLCDSPSQQQSRSRERPRAACKEPVHSLQLLRDNYGDDDSDDDIFLVNNSQSPKFDGSPDKASPTTNLPSLSRCSR